MPSEKQIIATLKRYEAGGKTADMCRKLGIQPGEVLHVEEAIHHGLGVPELRELR